MSQSVMSNWDFVKIVSKLILVLLLGFSLIMSDPLDYNPKHAYNQTLVPTKLSVTRLIDSLHMKIEKYSLPTILRVDQNEDKKAAVYSSKVYEYIQNYVFYDSEDDMPKFTENMGKRRISPMHVTMLLSGCYGNVWENNLLRRQINNSDTKNFGFLSVYNDDKDETNTRLKSWFLNVLLQSLDPVVTHDRGICSCLQDFAAASIMHVDEKEKKTYDTCQSQNMQDYTLNGEGEVVPMGEKHYMQIIPGFDDNTTGAEREYRNRNDPILTQVTEYFTAINPYNNLTLKNVPDLHNLIFTVSLNLINTADVFNTPMYKNYTSLGHVPLTSIQNDLDHFVKDMKSYNKLQAPTLAEVVNNKYQEQQETFPPHISLESYKNYLQSYENAFQICAHVGIPKYEKTIITFVDSTKYSHFAGSLLLLAATMAFTTYYKDICEMDNDGDSNYGALTIDVFSYGLQVAFIVVSVINLLEITSVDFGSHNSYLGFYFVLCWIIVILLFAITLYLIMKSYFTKSGENRSHAKIVFQQISMDLSVALGLTSMAIAFTLQRGFTDEHVILAVAAIYLCVGLVQHMSNVISLIFFHCLHDRNLKQNIEIKNIAYHKTTLIFILLFLFLAYGTRAASSYRVWTPDILYAHQHDWFFIICSFIILSGFDIGYEIFAYSSSEIIENVSVYSQHKSNWTGILILASLFFLHAHQFMGLCWSKQNYIENEGKTWAVCKPMGYFFGFGHDLME